jgi:tRNA (mo5U34)-methyltransferase
VNLAKSWTFDSDLTRRYSEKRQDFIKEFLAPVRKRIDLASAADIGCGVGHFAKFLTELRLQVVAVDGREENVSEGRSRYPEITFLARNVEDPSLKEIGIFDFVLCVGLLYHLENPFRAIRNLYSITQKILLIESMCVPGSEPMMDLLDESTSENQGLNYVAFYPSEPCLVKMLYRAGFPFVYRFERLPVDGQFVTTRWRKRSRTFLAASKIELKEANLVFTREPIRKVDTLLPWITPLSKVADYWAALRRGAAPRSPSDADDE